MRSPLPSNGCCHANGGNCLYVGLSKKHRVSRTFRATWYLKHLNQSVLTSLPVEQVSESMVVSNSLYLFDCVWTINLALQEAEERNNAEDISVLGMCGTGGVVNPSTQVFYVCQQYSLVFVLDMSNNMRSVVSEAESMR